LDLLRFQVSEISGARLQAGEEDRVEQEHRRAGNAARLLELGQVALRQLGDDENSLLTQAGQLGRILQELQRLDPAASSLATGHDQALSTLRDLQAEISRYADRIDVDPHHLQELEERLNLLQSLRRK